MELPAAAAPDPGDAPWSVEALREALVADPRCQHLEERRLLREAVADITGSGPGASQVADLDTLLAATLPEGAPGLSEREWVEAAISVERCLSHLEGLKLAIVAALDERVQENRPPVRLRRDTRRPAADALAPALKVAPGSATALVGLARQALDMPQAAQALDAGAMTIGQFRVLAGVLRRMPDAAARAQVEAIAVRSAVTEVRGRLEGVLEEAAVQADPGYAARARAMGLAERDVRLGRSPVPGCRRVLADLECCDAARFWQVLNQVATRAKDTPVLEEGTGQVGGRSGPCRSCAPTRW